MLQIHDIGQFQFIRHRNDSYDAKATGEICLQSRSVMAEQFEILAA